jgi:cobalt-zinc-cadmium efflux system protein
VGTTRLVLAIVFNALITAAEFVAGFVAGSLALMADAAHNLSDTASMGTSLVARRISARTADNRRTFGYERAELIGAFINLLTLVLIALYLLVEATQRYISPTSVDGTLMIWVGAATLAGNLATAFVLYRPAQDSLNIKSAFVHIVADAMGSVGVVAGGLLIQRYGWTFVDPLLTALIAGYILVHSYGMLRETISILMESAPSDLDLDVIVYAVEHVSKVRNVHHVHVWRLDEHRVALEAHVEVTGIRELPELDRLKHQIKTLLRRRFEIDHATLEFEHGQCADAAHPAAQSTHSCTTLVSSHAKPGRAG